MSNFTSYKTFLSVLLTLAFTGVSVGGSYHVEGMSPYSWSLANFEDKVFQEFEDKRKAEELRYEKKVKGKILAIMSDYNTGLDADDFKKWTILVDITN